VILKDHIARELAEGRHPDLDCKTRQGIGGSLETWFARVLADTEALRSKIWATTIGLRSTITAADPIRVSRRFVRMLYE
jgi:hypothetical protein